MIQDGSIMIGGNRDITSIEEQILLTQGLQSEQFPHTEFQPNPSQQMQQHPLMLQQLQQQQDPHMLQLQQQQQQLLQNVFLQQSQYVENNNGQMTANENIFMHSDYSPPCDEVTTVGVALETANTPNPANARDSVPEGNNPNPEDAFTYLQGLNSDNLMQFSQQSALQELMKSENLDDAEEPDLETKPNLNILPTFEEHDIGGYKFQINLSKQCKARRSNWTYSETLNKVYIRMNEICSVEVSYTSKQPVQQLRIRALLCFVNEVSEPVLRCQNHQSVDTESNSRVRRSLLRCENPNAEYCGQPQGKNINDRLSILIPLSGSTKQGAADSTQKQTIALKFTCQNSCIGRKETSVIFLLESPNGEILSQRVLAVKICSCPKRDKAMDERNDAVPKRKVTEDSCPRKRKLMKKEEKSPFSTLDTEDNTDDSDDHDENSTDLNLPNVQQTCSFDIQRTASSRDRIIIETANRDTTLSYIELSLKQVSYEMVSNPKHNASHYLRLYGRMRKLQRQLLSKIHASHRTKSSD